MESIHLTIIVLHRFTAYLSYTKVGCQSIITICYPCYDKKNPKKYIFEGLSVNEPSSPKSVLSMYLSLCIIIIIY